MSAEESRRRQRADLRPRVVEFLAAARERLGDRLVEGRYDPFLGLQVAVVTPTAVELAELEHAAALLGVGDRLRIEALEPADLHTWRSLRRDLVRLAEEQPQLLLADPLTGHSGWGLFPVEVFLSTDPGSHAAAAYLRDRYDAAVRVGIGRGSTRAAPLRPRTRPEGRVRGADDLAVGLSGPLSVRSGDTVVHGLDVANLGDQPVGVITDGDIRPDIVDPATGAVVGGFSGWHTQPQVTYRVAAGETLRLPLLVGTTGRAPNDDRPVAAGAWSLVARLHLADGRRLVTVPLDLTVTDGSAAST